MKKMMKWALGLAVMAGFAACESLELPGYTAEPQVLETSSPFTTLYKDIRYGEVPESGPEDRTSDRLLDLYIPKFAAPKGGYPVFLFVHGGGFSGGDKCDTGKGYHDISRAMAECGFAAISMNYYLTLKYDNPSKVSCSAEMKNGLPATGAFHPDLQKAMDNASDDAVAVLEWIKAHAEQYKLNPNHVVVCGGSAGSMTVLQLAYFSGQRVLPIRGVVNLWGGVANPSAIELPAPPMLIYHGDKDDLIHVDYAHAFEARLQELGVRVEKHILEGKGHAQYTYIRKNHINDIVEFMRSL